MSHEAEVSWRHVSGITRAAQDRSARSGSGAPLVPDVDDESELAGARAGHLAQLFRDAGLREIEESTLSVSVEHRTFGEWWEPYTLGVGPAGKFVADLDAARRTELRELCHELLPTAPFVLTARTWAARGIV